MLLFLQQDFSPPNCFSAFREGGCVKNPVGSCFRTLLLSAFEAVVYQRLREAIRDRFRVKRFGELDPFVDNFRFKLALLALELSCFRRLKPLCTNACERLSGTDLWYEQGQIYGQRGTDLWSTGTDLWSHPQAIGNGLVVYPYLYIINQGQIPA